MASSLTARANQAVLARHTARPRATVYVVAQQRSAPSKQEERPREVAANSTGSLAITFAAPRSTTGWIDQVAHFFGLAEERKEEEEWYREIGHLLDDCDKHSGHGHSMYVSHLAERMAVEPRPRN